MGFSLFIWFVSRKLVAEIALGMWLVYGVEGNHVFIWFSFRRLNEKNDVNDTPKV